MIAHLQRREPLKVYGLEILLHAGLDGLRNTPSKGDLISLCLTPKTLLAPLH